MIINKRFKKNKIEFFFKLIEIFGNFNKKCIHNCFFAFSSLMYRNQPKLKINQNKRRIFFIKFCFLFPK